MARKCRAIRTDDLNRTATGVFRSNRGESIDKCYKIKRMEGVMEVKDYCKNVDMELTVWKAKLYDVISKIEKSVTTGKAGGLKRL